MEIIVGTYDEIILGFRVVEVSEKLQLEACFTDRSHAGCVKCVAISPKGVLASGGSDETIRLLSLKKQKELGSLVHHNGSVTSLQFYKGFLFSSSEDNKMCIWKTFTWECLRTLKGHKAAINSLSVHPSGKMALTVGRDRTLHTWNLITAKTAFVSNIKQVADIVRWSCDGEHYVIVTGNKIDIYSVEEGEVQSSVQEESRVNCLEFLNNTTCVYGGEGGKVMFHDIKNNKKLHTCDTGTVRIKGLCLCPSPLEDDESDVMIVGSSEGYIKMYRIISGKQDEINTELLTEHNTSFRITCMAIYSTKTCSQVDSETATQASKVVKQKQRKRKLEKQEIDNDNDDVDSDDSEMNSNHEMDDEQPSPQAKKVKTVRIVEEGDEVSTQKGKKLKSRKQPSKDGLQLNSKKTVSPIKKKKKNKDRKNT